MRPTWLRRPRSQKDLSSTSIPNVAIKRVANRRGCEVPTREWVGPFEVGELLAHSIDDSLPRPPESGSAYVISGRAWSSEPTPDCEPLYVGGNTGRSARFRTRLGDLLADLFGFFGGGTGHHSGGITLHRWCRERGVNPMGLYVA